MLANDRVRYDDDDGPSNDDLRQRRRQHSAPLSQLTEAVCRIASAVEALTQTKPTGHSSALQNIKELQELYKMKSDLEKDSSQPESMLRIVEVEILRLQKVIESQQREEQ